MITINKDIFKNDYKTIERKRLAKLRKLQVQINDSCIEISDFAEYLRAMRSELEQRKTDMFRDYILQLGSDIRADEYYIGFEKMFDEADKCLMNAQIQLRNITDRVHHSC